MEALLLSDLVLVGPDRRIGLAVLLVKDRPLRDVDCETRLAALGKFNVVANLALEADIGNEALIGLGIEPRQVAGIRVSVRVAVRYIEQDDEIVAVGKFWRRVRERTAGAYFFQNRANLVHLDLLVHPKQDAE